jgi:hypothetical protein
MGVKICKKIDKKLKHKSMNISVYRASIMNLCRLQSPPLGQGDEA